MNRRPDFAAVSDLHLGEKKPACRTDDFDQAQRGKLLQLTRIAQDLPSMPWVYAGDIFDKPKGTPWSIAQAIVWLPEGVGVAGQHDLPGHSLDRIGYSALGILMAAETYRLIDKPERLGKSRITIAGASWGQELPEEADVAVLHRFTYTGRAPWPGVHDEARASWLMDRLPHKIVITGDNHLRFSYRHPDGRLLINPGSMMRRRADQEDHRPAVALCYLNRAKAPEVEFKELDIEQDVISREHIDPKEQLDARIQTFIARLDREYEVGLSFEENMKRFLHDNKLKKSVMALIMAAMEGGSNQ